MRRSIGWCSGNMRCDRRLRINLYFQPTYLLITIDSNAQARSYLNLNSIFFLLHWLSYWCKSSPKSPRTANQLHDISHGFQFLGVSNHQVRAPRVDPNFGPNWFEPQAKRLTFTCKMTALNANLTVLAGKLHNVTFGVITRNITRLLKMLVSH